MTTRVATFALLLLTPLTLCACNGGLGPIVGATRTPTFDYGTGESGGCADIYLYKGSADRREVLWVSADKEKLKLPAKGSVTFDLTEVRDGLELAVDLWKKAPTHSAYCNDISADAQREATWKATKGKVTFTVFEPTANPGSRPTYKVSARLENIVFDDGAGHTATLKEATFTEVMVGWYAG